MKKGIVHRLFVLLLVISVVSCGARKSPIEAGFWDKGTFTNSWLNMSVALPTEFRILDAQEANTLLGLKEGVYVNNGKKLLAQDLKDLTTFYDFSVVCSEPLVSISLYYENLLKGWRKNLTPRKYFDQLCKSLNKTGKNLPDFTFSSSESPMIIAGEEYFIGYAHMEGLVYHDYYIRKVDDAMVVIAITYTASGTDLVGLFLSSIATP